MAAIKRIPTNYPGVSYREVKRIGGPGLERVYYVRWKQDGEIREDHAGGQYRNDMTPARAAPDQDRQGADVMRLALATGMR